MMIVLQREKRKRKLLMVRKKARDDAFICMEKCLEKNFSLDHYTLQNASVSPRRDMSRNKYDYFPKPSLLADSFC